MWPHECQVCYAPHCFGTENVWKYKIFNCWPQCHCWLPSLDRAAQTRWEELQGVCSVHLFRLPHFLNCRVIVQADQNLTGYKERTVTSKSWGYRYFPTYTAFASLFLNLLCFSGLTSADFSSSLNVAQWRKYMQYFKHTGKLQFQSDFMSLSKLCKYTADYTANTLKNGAPSI